MICYKPSFPPPDQAENDAKDKVYQLRESFTPSFLRPSRIVHTVIPDTSGIAFFVREIPNQVGNDIVDKFQCDSGSQAGMTEEKQSCLSAIPPDQVEGDVKDTIYQTTGIVHTVIPDPRSGRE